MEIPFDFLFVTKPLEVLMIRFAVFAPPTPGPRAPPGLRPPLLRRTSLASRTPPPLRGRNPLLYTMLWAETKSIEFNEFRQLSRFRASRDWPLGAETFRVEMLFHEWCRDVGEFYVFFPKRYSCVGKIHGNALQNFDGLNRRRRKARNASEITEITRAAS